MTKTTPHLKLVVNNTGQSPQGSITPTWFSALQQSKALVAEIATMSQDPKNDTFDFKPF